MIYFIDEDYRKLRALVSELKFNNFNAKVIRDADTAYSELAEVKPDEVDIVIIDVMLAAKANADESRYPREKTDDYHKTGLLLLDDLVRINPAVFPKYAIYLTHASNNELVKLISASAKKHSINLLRKKDYDTAFDFGEDIVEIISKIRKKT